MFASHFFAAHFFAPRYFNEGATGGGGGGSSTSPFANEIGGFLIRSS